MPNPNRRDVIAGLAALRESTLLPSRSAAQQPATGGRVIDRHRHFVSPSLLKALTAKEGHTTESLTSFFPLALWKE